MLKNQFFSKIIHNFKYLLFGESVINKNEKFIVFEGLDGLQNQEVKLLATH